MSEQVEPVARSGRIQRVGMRGLLVVGLVAASSLGCNVIETVFGGDVFIRNMVAGQKLSNGQVDCWLTLEFKGLPENARDIRVRFESVALEEPAEFDWAYIARHDVVSQGARFGSGHAPLKKTTPSSPPPLGEELKVNFPLRAKRKLDPAPSAIWLHASVYYGYDEQDSDKRRLDHVYERESGSFF